MDTNPNPSQPLPQATPGSSDSTERKRTIVLAVISIIFLLLLFLLLRPNPGAEGTSNTEGTDSGSTLETSAGGDGQGGGGGDRDVAAPGGHFQTPLPANTNAVVFFNPFPPSSGPVKPGTKPGGTSPGGSSQGGAPVFMGTQGKGSKFVFIIDKSGSMAAPFRGNTRFSTACGHLTQFIMGLIPGQQFQVIFYNHQHHPMPPFNQIIAGNPANKASALQWIQMQQPGGGTSPHASLQAALAMQPDTIWLLADGQFNNNGALMNIIRNSVGNVMINTIAIDTLPGGIMNNIAALTGGNCRMINF